MSVLRAVLTKGSWLSQSDIASLALLALAGCNFDSQPLFEPARSDAMTGQSRIETDAQLPLPGASTDGAPLDGLDAGPGSGSARCVPGQVQSCSAGRALTCKGDGSGFEPLDCGAAGCNAAANGCNECLPSSAQCMGESLVHCAADGHVQTLEACALGCVSVAGGPPACRACVPGSSMCQGAEVARCAPDGMSWQTQPCSMGCDAALGACMGSQLVPSNLPADACRATGLSKLDVTANATLDTDQACRGVVAQGAGLPDLCLIAYEEVRVREGVVLRVQGARALALLATRSLRIEGRISVSAEGNEAGAGSVDGALGAGGAARGRLADGSSPPGPAGMVIDWAELPANAGGGGGGHGTSGAPGGDAPSMCGPKQSCASGGLGGLVHGHESLSPLQGGSMGGVNSASEESSRRSEPGGGGGALQLIACEELELGARAVLDANGGGGEGGGPGSAENAVNDTPGGGSGGGSGGAILLQAKKLSVKPGAVLAANGGGGGGGASRSVKGALSLQGGQDGEDGKLSSEPAAGGKAAGMSQPGGAGGALLPPTSGGSAQMRTTAAGGGGGAAGRIRIETGTGDAILEGVVISPPASRGRALFE